jgi:HEAT repeat protein
MTKNTRRIGILTAAAIVLVASAAFSQEIDKLIQTFDTNGWDDLTAPQEARARLVEIGPEAIPALMAALNHKNDRVRTWCEAALMQIAQEGPKFQEAVTDALLDSLSKIMTDSNADLNQRQIAVRLLARLGGQRSARVLADNIDDEAIGDYVVFFLAEKGSQAVPYLQKALQSDSVEAQAEAAKALGRTGDGSAIAPLWTAFANAGPALKVTILQSIIRIGGDEALTPLKEAAKDDDVSVRTQAARGIGQLGGSAEIAILEQMLKDDEAVRIAAADGLIMLGDRQRENGDSDNAKRAYLSAYDAVFNQEQVSALAKRLRELGETVDVSKKFGSIYDWWIIGPFDNADGKGFDTVYPPEKETVLTKTYESMEKSLGWRKHHTENVIGRVDATTLIRPNTNAALYALAFVESPAEMDVQIRAGSDDTLSIWLNGKRIHHHKVARGVTFDQDKVDAHLQRGVNSLLLKVCQGGGGWGFVARIVDENGKPIPALKVLSEQPR